MSAFKNCSEYSFETKAIHSNKFSDNWGHNEMVAPIVTSTTFFLEDPTTEDVSSLYAVKCLLYSRYSLTSKGSVLL